MKITIIAPVFPYRGGIAQSTEILYHKLVERGHSVRLINFRRQYPDLLFPGKTQYVSDPAGASTIASERLLDSIAPYTWVKAARAIKSEQPDVLIFRYWMPFFAPMIGCICRLVRKRFSGRIVMICDNVIPHEPRPGDLALTRFAFKHVDHVILLSEYVKQDLLRLNPRADHDVVPHPVYESFGEAVDKQQAKQALGLSAERVVLFFGYVRAYKGLDILLAAMPEILENQPLKLLIVGEFYDSEEKYRKQIASLGIREHVQIYSEFVPDNAVRRYFSAADVVVLPYKSATQSGIVQLAYHLNKPCIVTDVGGLSEVVLDGKTGYVVEPDNPKAVAEAVKRFYRENREEAFSKNVRKEKRKYSWQRMVEVIEQSAQNRSKS